MSAKNRIWRLNAQTLWDQAMVEKLKQGIETYIEISDNGAVSQTCYWDAMKVTVRDQIVSATAYKRKEQQKFKNLILHNIEKIRKLT